MRARYGVREKISFRGDQASQEDSQADWTLAVDNAAKTVRTAMNASKTIRLFSFRLTLIYKNWLIDWLNVLACRQRLRKRVQQPKKT